LYSLAVAVSGVLKLAAGSNIHSLFCRCSISPSQGEYVRLAGKLSGAIFDDEIVVG
jgi:hypothetical protein